MRKSPDERYATPLEVAQALEPYVDEQAGVVESDHSLVSENGTRDSLARLVAWPIQSR